MLYLILLSRVCVRVHTRVRVAERVAGWVTHAPVQGPFSCLFSPNVCVSVVGSNAAFASPLPGTRTLLTRFPVGAGQGVVTRVSSDRRSRSPLSYPSQITRLSQFTLCLDGSLPLGPGAETGALDETPAPRLPTLAHPASSGRVGTRSDHGAPGCGWLPSGLAAARVHPSDVIPRQAVALTQRAPNAGRGRSGLS